MRLAISALGLALLSSGCTSIALERDALNQSESASDIRYKEVLHNLAVLVENPWALPAWSTIYAGTARLSDQGTVGAATSIGREAVGKTGATVTHFQSGTLDLMAQRTLSENWSLDPVSSPEKLRAMRCACWWVLPEGRGCLTPDCLALLSSFAQDPSPGYHFDELTALSNLPAGWLHIGSAREAPHCAVYRACCGHTCAWVTPDGLEGLSAFTLILQDIARVNTNAMYFPKPITTTLTYTVTNKEGNDTVKETVTAYVDRQGRAVSAAGTYAYPVKQRLDNIGTDAQLRSQNAAVGIGR